MKLEWKKVDEVANFFGRCFGEPAKLMIVLGSGLSDVADVLEDSQSCDFEQIPGWPKARVQGHAGQMRYGTISGKKVLLQMGRIHLYEGHDPGLVVRSVRAGISWGIPNIFLTNAAGGIKTSFSPGDLMMIGDHINLVGQNPLVGENDDTRGPRFPDMSAVYDEKLLATAIEKAGELGITLSSGVYAGVLGPSYETKAEVTMLSKMGADAVGMSTVLEAIAARHLGARVVGMSCITNLATGLSHEVLSHDEVRLSAATAKDNAVKLITALVEEL